MRWGLPLATCSSSRRITTRIFSRPGLPDGRSIAFTTDRFTTDLTMLRFGVYRIATIDLATRTVSMAPAFAGADQVDPSWSPDGSSLYFISTSGGIRNVFRTTPSDGRLFQVTDVSTGVSGVTGLSPALSIASKAGTVAFSTYRDNGYEIHTLRDAGQIAGTPVDGAAALPPVAAIEEPETIEPVPQLPLPHTASVETGYRPRLSLEAVGSPYFSAGGGSFGSYVQGGMSLLFGDLLGDRQLVTALHLNSHFDESSFGTMFVDRSSRWTWGLTGEQTPEVLLRTTAVRPDASREGALTRDYERQVWTHRHVSGFVAYPLNRSQRFEFSAGMRQLSFNREGRTQVFVAGNRAAARTGGRRASGAAIDRHRRSRDCVRRRHGGVRGDRAAPRQPLSLPGRALNRRVDLHNGARGLSPLLHAGSPVYARGAVRSLGTVRRRFR